MANKTRKSRPQLVQAGLEYKLCLGRRRWGMSNHDRSVRPAKPEQKKEKWTDIGRLKSEPMEGHAHLPRPSPLALRGRIRKSGDSKVSCAGLPRGWIIPPSCFSYLHLFQLTLQVLGVTAMGSDKCLLAWPHRPGAQKEATRRPRSAGIYPPGL